MNNIKEKFVQVCAHVRESVMSSGAPGLKDNRKRSVETERGQQFAKYFRYDSILPHGCKFWARYFTERTAKTSDVLEKLDLYIMEVAGLTERGLFWKVSDDPETRKMDNLFNKLAEKELLEWIKYWLERGKSQFINKVRVKDGLIHVEHFAFLWKARFHSLLCTIQQLVPDNVWETRGLICGFLQREKVVKCLKLGHKGTFMIRFSKLLCHTMVLTWNDGTEKEEKSVMFDRIDVGYAHNLVEAILLNGKAIKLYDPYSKRTIRKKKIFTMPTQANPQFQCCVYQWDEKEKRHAYCLNTELWKRSQKTSSLPDDDEDFDISRRQLKQESQYKDEVIAKQREKIQYLEDQNQKLEKIVRDMGLTVGDAVLKNKMSVIRLLLETGFDPNGTGTLPESSDVRGSTGLHYCAKFKRKPEMLQLLIDAGADLNARDQNGNTPLHIAANKNFVDVARRLLDANCSLDVPNKEKKTALAVAVECVRSEIIQMLLDRGADVNFPTYLPLVAAQCEWVPVDISKTLIGARAEVNQLSLDMELPLIRALQVAYHDSAACLINSGADVNLMGDTSLGRNKNKKKNMEKPLAVACRVRKSAEIIPLLIEDGCDLNYRDKETNESALDVILAYDARCYEHECNTDEVVRLLVAHGCDLGKHANHYRVKKALETATPIRESIRSALAHRQWNDTLIDEICDMLLRRADLFLETEM